MENLLIMGINTRPMINSGLKLNYKLFSISYFKTLDFKEPYKEKHILHQKNNKTCGSFEENYSPDYLLKLAKDYLYEDKIDKIVFNTGISANEFKGEYSKFKHKIRGNLKTEEVENKFKFYKKIRNKFNVPLTFKVDNVWELKEILKQYEDKQFILKPLYGSGGLGIKLLNNNSYNQLNHEKNECENDNENNILNKYIIQEYISGTNISSSVLSTKKESKNLINSRLLTEEDLGHEENYTYSGNILPLDHNSFSKYINKNSHYKKYDKIEIAKLNKTLANESEKLIKEFKLIGSNGVDFIINNKNTDNNKSKFNKDDLYIIEANPRLQGTYEPCEEVLGINLLDAHIKACEGELINIPKPKQYSIKKIIYANKQVAIGDLAIENVYDIPYKGVKIEKNQPIVTIVSSDKKLDLAIKNKEIANKKVEKNIKK